MFGIKNATGLWRFLPAVSCAAALLSVCVCVCVVFSAKQNAQTSALQSDQQQQGIVTTDATPVAQEPQFRAFNDGLEVLQNGIWVPIETLDQMQQSDPLEAALQVYMEENGLTSTDGEALKHLEEAGASSEQEPMLHGRVSEKRDDSRDDTSEESDAYL